MNRRILPRRSLARQGRAEGPRLLEALVAVLVVVALCSLGGCATGSHAPRTRRLPAPIAAASAETAPAPGRAKVDEGAAFVARSLRDGGLRFGTDGSTRALWEYLRNSHRTISPERARAGDVVFFDTRATDRAPDCDDATDHAGLVESVEPDGRIVFVETRGGQVRRSVVDPAHPTLRRTERGEIANTFLRPKRVADPPGARYFAGEMLCGSPAPTDRPRRRPRCQPRRWRSANEICGAAAHAPRFARRSTGAPVAQPSGRRFP
jgi:hypothetical protein